MYKILNTLKCKTHLNVLLSNRGVTDKYKYLEPSCNHMHNPFLMKDMLTAVDMIKTEEGIICIIGDYDTDGVTALHILHKGLQHLNKKHIQLIPDRQIDGYGISKRLIDMAHIANASLIITCDNGIAAVNEIEYAHSLGIKVIVTDHHNVGKILPNADAIINPKQPDCKYPYKELCGAGVAYKLVQALGYKEELLDIVAIATIADCVPLTDENRDIVAVGLGVLEETTNVGLIELLRLKGLLNKTLDTYDIGFIIAPILNAAGRLDTAQLSLSLLNCTSKSEASDKIRELDKLNTERREMTFRYTEELLTKIKSCKGRVVVVEGNNIPDGIAGIVAGRLKSKLNKPVIIVSNGKGSGRSIDAYNIYKALLEFKCLFTTVGGHNKACGFTLDKGVTVKQLSDCLNRHCTLSQEELSQVDIVDCELKFKDISKRLIREIEMLKPYGEGNPKPLYGTSAVSIKTVTYVGKDSSVLRFVLEDKDHTEMEAVLFETTLGGVSMNELLNGVKHPLVNITYVLKLNKFNNGIQLVLHGIEVVS